MELAPHRVIAVATDAVYFSGTAPVAGLDIGPELGQWDDGDAGSDSVWIQPGVYALKARGRWKNRSRGFRLKSDLVEALDTSRRCATLPITACQSLGEAVTQRSAELFNVIRDASKTLDPNTDFKRSWPSTWGKARDLLARQMRSTPLHLNS